MDIAANTAAQFFGRRFGEGHHQQLFHADSAEERRIPRQVQQQPQIQCGDGKGFPVPAGLYQALARQGKRSGSERLGGFGHSLSHQGKDFCNALTFSQTLPSCGWT